MSKFPIFLWLAHGLIASVAYGQVNCSALLGAENQVGVFGRLAIRANEVIASAHSRRDPLEPVALDRVVLARSVLSGRAYALFLTHDRGEKSRFLALGGDANVARWREIEDAAEDVLFLENRRLLRISKIHDALSNQELTLTATAPARFKPETLNAEVAENLASLPEPIATAIGAFLPRLKREIFRGRLNPADLSRLNIKTGVSDLDQKPYLVIMANGPFSSARDLTGYRHFGKPGDFLIPLAGEGALELREVGETTRPQTLRLDYRGLGGPSYYQIK